MATNHKHDHRSTTATRLDPLTDAVELLADHGYDVTTATIAADPSPDARATITLELAVPDAGTHGSEPVSADEADVGADPGDADGDTPVSESSADAPAATANRDRDSVTPGTTAPLARCEERERTGTERAAPTDSSQGSADATAADTNTGTSEEATEGSSEETSGEYWCRKCGYGPGTKRAIAIHNGHKHGGDAAYASTEPAPGDGTASETTERTPEEIDAIVEDIVGSSPAEDGATEHTASGVAREPDESAEPAGDRSDGAGNASPASADGGDGVGADASSANDSSADAPDEPVTELPDLGFPIPDRVTVDAVREAVDGAENIEDVRESLKWPAGQCRILLQEMDLGTDLLDAPPRTGARRRSKRTV